MSEAVDGQKQQGAPLPAWIHQLCLKRDFCCIKKNIKCKIKLKYIIFNACSPDADLTESDQMSEEQKDDHNLCDFDLKIK